MASHLTLEQLKKLGEHQADSCVSLYLPTGIRGVDADKRRVEIKNLINTLLKDDEDKLSDSCYKKLKSLNPEVISIGTYGAGTKIYFFDDEYEFYMEVPALIDPFGRVNDSFYLVPLFQLWFYEKPHYLLKLSLNHVELFLVTGLRFEKVEFKIPWALQEYYSPDMDEWSLKKFNEIRDSYSESKKIDLALQAAPHADRYFGSSQFDKYDIRDAETTYFLRHIDMCLMETIEDKSVPLIIAADEHVARLYMECSRYPLINKNIIRGNPDRLSQRELHQETVERIKKDVIQRSQPFYQEFTNLENSPQAVDDLEKLELAANSGVIKTLLLNWEAHRMIAQQHEDTHLTPDEQRKLENFEDKINRIATKTLTHGGQILWFQHGVLPTTSPAAAVLHTAI